jgi:hypothetical protein
VFLHDFDGYEIRQRSSDGFIKATDMCKAGKMKWTHYYRTKTAKLFIKELKSELLISNSLIQSNRSGKYENRGTWVHPRIAIHLAQWISSKFAVEVTGWVMEWTKFNETNTIILLSSMSNLKIDEPRKNRERKVQTYLHDKLGGSVEVPCEGDYIDLLTETQIIEIKNIKKWKHALGQILVYSDDYPNHEKVLYLFGTCENTERIEKHCDKFGVTVKYVE